MTISETSDLDLLRQAMQASGLSSTQYALTVLVRDPRTVRRWLAGQSPMPQSVRDFLKRWQEQGGGGPEPERVEPIAVSE